MGFKAFQWHGNVVYIQKTSKLDRIKLFFENRKVIKLKYGRKHEHCGI